MQIKMKKLTAVTLIELLAVLSIMGVITALTLPGLKKHSQKSEYAALAQKGFVTLEHAIDMAVADTGQEIDEWNRPDVASFMLRDYLRKYFNGAKDCIDEWSGSNSCFVGYSPFNGSTKTRPYVRAIILADGIVIAGDGGTSGRFIIDVNADAPPNKEGVDVFLFELRKSDPNCNKSATGQWKLCPTGHAKNLMEDGWKINYY